MKRIGIDGGLLLFLIGAMCCPFSPKTGHEAAGVAFFFIAAAHVYENRGWLRSLAKGQSPFLTVPRMLNLLLGLTLLAVTVTGVLISNDLSPTYGAANCGKTSYSTSFTARFLTSFSSWQDFI